MSALGLPVGAPGTATPRVRARWRSPRVAAGWERAESHAEAARRIWRAWEEGRGVWLASPCLEGMARRLGLERRTEEGVPVVWFGPGRVGRLEAGALRVLEWAVAALVLVLGAPLWLLTAAAVRLDGGPVLHRSLRAGRGGRPFEFLKFRTMAAGGKPDEDEARRRYRMHVIRGAAPHVTDGRGRRVTKLPHDRRVTCIGRVLRRTSLDEIPQLLHVLAGTMALVGPRPYLLDEVEAFRPWHQARFRARPGVTGLWQVEGRSLVGFDDSVMLDLYHISNRSLPLDLTVILKTPLRMLSGQGAY